MNHTIDIKEREHALSEPPSPHRHRNVERLLHGSIPATLARLAAPNTVAFLVSSAVMVAEMWFVGQLGTTALAGLALGYPMFMLLMMLSAGAMGGAMAAAVARAVGAGDIRRAEDLGWHALVIALIAAALFTFLYLAFGPALYALLGGSGETLAVAIAYSDIALVGGGVIWLANTLSSILRGTGDMKTPAAAMLLAAAIQVPLSGGLALGWGPPARPGHSRCCLGRLDSLWSIVDLSGLSFAVGAQRFAFALARSPPALGPVQGHPGDWRHGLPLSTIDRCNGDHADRPGQPLWRWRPGRIGHRLASRIPADPHRLWHWRGHDRHGWRQYRRWPVESRSPH